MVDVEEVISFLETSIAPIKRQLTWDNSGKQIYYPHSKVKTVALALDPTEVVINKTIDMGCELLITHHPLFFNKLQNIDLAYSLSRKISLAILAKLNVISFHTNFDTANYNTSDYICELLGAQKISFLDRTGQENFYKFVIYIPVGFEEKIIEAIDKAGAGSIGNYKKCTFHIKGTGTFEPGETANPFIGVPGKFEEVNEVRIETIVKEENLNTLINKVLEVHPYEEPAYDVYALNNSLHLGLGTIGFYRIPISMDDFYLRLKKIFNHKFIRFNNVFDIEQINKFAIVAGSGSGMWRICKEKGLKLLLTGDLKHHDAVEASENGIMIIDIGHFESECLFLTYIKRLLENKFDIKIEIIEEKPSINYKEV